MITGFDASLVAAPRPAGRPRRCSRCCSRSPRGAQRPRPWGLLASSPAGPSLTWRRWPGRPRPGRQQTRLRAPAVGTDAGNLRPAQVCARRPRPLGRPGAVAHTPSRVRCDRRRRRGACPSNRAWRPPISSHCPYPLGFPTPPPLPRGPRGPQHPAAPASRTRHGYTCGRSTVTRTESAPNCCQK